MVLEFLRLLFAGSGIAAGAAFGSFNCTFGSAGFSIAGGIVFFELKIAKKNDTNNETD